MKPKERAKELVNRFIEIIEHQDHYWGVEDESKKCALLCVDEILNSNPTYPTKIPSDKAWLESDECEQQAKEYWQQVKSEIQKL